MTVINLPKTLTPAEYRAAAKKPHKYRAKAETVDGIRFDSKGEAARWRQLRLLERTGEICDLKRQVKFPICLDGTYICTVVMDFVYIDVKKDRHVNEDFKGVRTPLYRLKKRLFEAYYGEKITETGKSSKRTGARVEIGRAG